VALLVCWRTIPSEWPTCFSSEGVLWCRSISNPGSAVNPTELEANS